MQSKDDIPNTDIGFWLEYYVEVNERSETHCVEIYFLNLQSYLLNIAIIFANHPFSTKLDTQQQTTKHLLFDNAAALSFYAIQASLTLTHRPIIYQGNFAKESVSFSAQPKAKRGGCDLDVWRRSRKIRTNQVSSAASMCVLGAVRCPSVHAACQHDAVQLLNIMHSKAESILVYSYSFKKVLFVETKCNILPLSDPRRQGEAALRTGLCSSRAGEVQNDLGEVKTTFLFSS